jgi:integrase
MPTPAKGTRLWLRKARRDRSGRITRKSVWLIRDGKRDKSTGCGPGERAGAEKSLSAYLNRKQVTDVTKGVRHPSQIPVASVIALYSEAKAEGHARPKETGARFDNLLDFFGDKMLSDINGDLCRKYAAARSTDAAARRELEDLRAAVNMHLQEGQCSEIIKIVLPRRRPPRERWLTRQEAAQLIRHAWHYREIQKGSPTGRFSRRHLAKFSLVAAYTGTRASAICGAALQPTPGSGWIDLERGVFYRRPIGKQQTKKRQPAIPLPVGLLTHLRRWKRMGQRYAVEWNGQPVRSVSKGFRNAVRDAGLSADVTPHVWRHTCATWMLQRGTPPFEVAGYTGMTLQTVQDIYGHHSPDHLSKARKSFSQHRDDAVADAVARRAAK